MIGKRVSESNDFVQAFARIYVREHELIGKDNVTHVLFIGFVNGDVVSVPYASKDTAEIDANKLTDGVRASVVLNLQSKENEQVKIRTESVAYTHLITVDCLNKKLPYESGGKTIQDLGGQ